MKKSLLFGFLLISVVSVAQQPIRDTLKTSTKPTLTLAALYSSDVNYFGQTTTSRLPYALGYAGLAFNSGFYLSGSVYQLLNTGGGISGGDLTAGYDFDLSKNLSAGLSYTRSFFPDSSFFLQSANLNMFSGKLGYDFTFLTAGLNADYSPGTDQALYVSLDLKKAIELLAFNESAYLSFEPGIEVIGSTQQITSTEEVPPSNGGSGSGLGIIRLPGRGGSQKPEYRTVQSTSFDMLSYGLRLPLSYNTPKFSAEAGYQAYAIKDNPDSSSKNPRSFFTLGLYYAL